MAKYVIRTIAIFGRIISSNLAAAAGSARACSHLLNMKTHIYVQLDLPAEDGDGATWACTGEHTSTLCHCRELMHVHDDVTER